MATERVRMQISLDPEIAAKMDIVCKQMGLTRSQYVSYLVGASLMQFDTVNTLITKNFSKFLNSSSEKIDKLIEERKKQQ